MRMRKYCVALAMTLVCALSACSGDKNKESETAADAAEKAASEVKPGENATTLDAANVTSKVDEPEAPKEIKALADYEIGLAANQRIAADLADAQKQAEAGDKVKAIQTLEAAEKKEPKAFLAPFNKALIYEWSGQSYAAENAYMSALRAEPHFSPALENYVRLKVATGDAIGAYNMASNYVVNYPDAFDHNVARIEAMIGLKKYDEAILEARRLLKIDEANPRLRYEIANAEFQRGRYNLAEFVVKESLEIDPDNVDALFLLAKIHSKLSETDSTYAATIASELDKVLTKQRYHAEALWMRGVIFYQQNEFAKAEKTFRMLLDISPNLVEAHINLANVLKTLNRGPEAETLLNKAATMAPADPEVDFAFGTLYLNVENIQLPDIDELVRLQTARTYFESAASKTSDKAEIKIYKGYIRTTDDAIDALKAMREAAELFGE